MEKLHRPRHARQNVIGKLFTRLKRWLSISGFRLELFAKFAAKYAGLVSMHSCVAFGA